MYVQQISIFVENKPGRLAAVTRLLADEGVNIRALSLADTSDFGVLRLIVNDPELAYTVLKDQDFIVSRTDVLAIEMPDVPGGLAHVLEVLGAAKVNIEYLYAFVGQSGHQAMNIFRIEDMEAATVVLKENKIKVLPKEEVYAL
ncbi:MAG: ACT domain-containing protein [Firmicutes bacterium]|jgi:hypothetical protein|nr:ACT domain-containing protein [Bacillota bacterium]